LKCIFNSCQCDSQFNFWDGLTCSKYRIYGESCLTSGQCNKTQMTTCLGGKCDCNSTNMYFDFYNSRCYDKKSETETCTECSQCLKELICSSGTCLCPNTITQYYDSTQLKCLNKTLNNTFCTQNVTCRSDLGLSCLSSSCQCDSHTSFWSAIELTCVVCPAEWISFRSKCYRVFNSSKTWDEAQSQCQSYGGDLVSVKVQSDFDIVSYFYLQYTDYQKLWIGARMNITYDFYWRDGISRMTQTSPNSNWWCVGNPNNYPENSQIGDTNIRQGCVRMQKGPNDCNDVTLMCNQDFCFNDLDCNTTQAFLCERQ
jgi:hypothetical protein